MTAMGIFAVNPEGRPRPPNDPQIAAKFNRYPDNIRTRLLYLRQLIFATADAMESVGEVIETLKWDQPSYVTKTGSTLRIDWQQSDPECYRMYCHCRSRLIESFKEVYGNRFEFDGNRAIVFHEHKTVPCNDLVQCIAAALNYHRVKHLPLLGL